jgi:glucose 1-dehydrogenase
MRPEEVAMPDPAGQAEFDGKIALVTGAGSGIGHAIARALSQAGTFVVVNDIGDASGMVAAELGGLGRALPVVADVGDAEQVAAMFDKLLKDVGRLDILVNNAGIEIDAPFLEIAADDWDKVHRTNLKGALLCGQHAARAMIGGHRGGRIINISSVHEELPDFGTAGYAASKGGLRMLTKVMALELAEHGITVNAIAPGAIETPMNRALLESEEARTALEGIIPARRIGQPEEVARLAVFLASAGAGYITGSTYYVDGGLSLTKGLTAGRGAHSH